MELMLHKRRGGRPHRDTLVRFWEKVDKRGPSECWNWMGTLSKAGYGKFSIGSSKGSSYIQAHAFSYILYTKRPMPVGLEPDHLCRNPRCVNPSHIEPVTHIENMRRGDIWKRCGQYQAAKTHCAKGHELVKRNIRGFRYCRICATTRRREQYRQSHATATNKQHYPYGKLTKEIARQVMEASGTHRKIAAAFGLSQVMVTRIKGGKHTATLGWSKGVSA